MRSALALLLLAHGLAHFVGFLTPWGMMPRETSTAPVRSNLILGGRVHLGVIASRGLSVVWLSLAAAFVVVAFGLWQQSAWSVGASIVACLVSLVVTLVWWPIARIGAAINLAVLAGLFAVAVTEFRGDMRRAKEHVARSSMVQTAGGPIEYATLGDGQPVLALHGTAGGWDQALSSAAGVTQYGYRVIAPSRFGYLRTPWRADASPILEADTWAMLLDSLGIDRVAVMSWSAGAAPAIQFALRHPGRVSKLVFFVPGAGGLMPPPPGPPMWVVDLMFKWDFPIWAAQRLMPNTMLRWVAVPPSLVTTLDSHDRAALDAAIDGIFPVSLRHDGMIYDAQSQSGAFGLFPIERVAASSLWISAQDDLYQTLRVATHAASIIPKANLIQYETGGHLLLGRGADLWPRVARFLGDSL